MANNLYIHTKDVADLCMFVLVGPKIGLNEPCGPDDFCAGSNTVCLNGRCNCRDGYATENDACGKEGFILLLGMINCCEFNEWNVVCSLI